MLMIGAQAQTVQKLWVFTIKRRREGRMYSPRG